MPRTRGRSLPRSGQIPLAPRGTTGLWLREYALKNQGRSPMHNLFTNCSRLTTLSASFENARTRTRPPNRSNLWRNSDLFRKLRLGVSVLGTRNGNAMQIGPAPGSTPSCHERELTPFRLSPRDINNAQIAQKRACDGKVELQSRPPGQSHLTNP